MFKSIFGKLISIFLSIFIIGFTITGTMLYIFLDNYVVNDRSKALEETGWNIYEQFKLYIQMLLQARAYENSLIQNLIMEQASNYFETSLKFYQRNTYALIWIVDQNGTLLFYQPDFPESVKKKLRQEDGSIRLTDENMYKRIMSGQENVIVQKGDFYGFFKDETFKYQGDLWLTVQIPMRYDPGNGYQEVVAAAFLHTPFPEIRKLRTQVFNFFMQAVLLGALITTFLIYIFSRRLIKPIKQINQAAKIIAGGDFQKRLDIRSRDEIGELAATFNQMVAALQNLEDMRRGFIANVSHELRTPMTTIRGFIEGILDGTIPPEKQRDYLSIVKDEVDRLNRLVNDLLDLARIEAGEMKLTMKSFDINELIRRCIIKMEQFFINKKIQVEALFEEEDLLAWGDVDSIERVMMNLIHNAIKFTPENGKIVVSTRTQKDLVLVTIEDNGIGISKDEIDRIWERFYKSDKSRSRDKSGTGLGLAIVKNIIHEHKQRIWVESEPGKGTRFTFTLYKS